MASPVCAIQEIVYNHKIGTKDMEHPQGYLIYMQMSKLLEILSVENGGVLRPEDLKLVQAHRNEAIEGLVKRLMSGYRGIIGIYYTGDAQVISIGDKFYPVFTLTLPELCVACQEVGYGIVIGGKPCDPRQVVQRGDAVLKSLIVAPQENALLIKVAPMIEDN